MSTMLFEMIQKGSKVKEIPFVFYERQHGQSKLITKDLFEFFFNAFRLRKELIKLKLSKR